MTPARDIVGDDKAEAAADHLAAAFDAAQVADAAEIITAVIANSAGDPQLTNYCFYAGVIFKSLGDYDRASDFFFEATQAGPPRYFSQIEMMTIISRNLEEMNADGEGEDNEDAYRMVHCNLHCSFISWYFSYFL